MTLKYICFLIYAKLFQACVCPVLDYEAGVRLWNRLLNMDDNRLAKEIFKWGIQQNGPRIVNMCDMFNVSGQTRSGVSQSYVPFVK